jgi:hypothetical protein
MGPVFTALPFFLGGGGSETETVFGGMVACGDYKERINVRRKGVGRLHPPSFRNDV